MASNFELVAMEHLTSACAASSKCRTSGNEHLKVLQTLVAEAKIDIIATPGRAIPLLSVARKVLASYSMAVRVLHRALKEVTVAERKWNTDSSATSALHLFKECDLMAALLPAMSNYLFAVAMCDGLKIAINAADKPASVLTHLLNATLGTEVDNYESNEIVSSDQIIHLENRDAALIPSRAAMLQSSVRRGTRTLKLYKQVAKLQHGAATAVVADKLLFRLCKLHLLLADNNSAREGLRQLLVTRALDQGALTEVAAELAALDKLL